MCTLGWLRGVARPRRPSPNSSVQDFITLPDPCRRRSPPWCRWSSRDRDVDRPFRPEPGVGRGLELGLAFVGGVVPRAAARRARSAARLLPGQDPQREGHAGPADRAGLGDGRTGQAFDRAELPDEAGIAGPDHGTSGVCDSTSASTITLSMLEVQISLNGVPVAMKARIRRLPWSCRQPVKTSWTTLTSRNRRAPS